MNAQEYVVGDWILNTHHEIRVVTEVKLRQGKLWTRKLGGSQIFLEDARSVVNYFPTDDEYHEDAVLYVQPDTLVMVYTNLAPQTPFPLVYEWKPAVFKYYACMDRSMGQVVVDNLLWAGVPTSPRFMRFATAEERLEFSLTMMRR